MSARGAAAALSEQLIPGVVGVLEGLAALVAGAIIGGIATGRVRVAVPKEVAIVSGFALKVVLGSLAFAVVALAAVGLKAGLSYMEKLVSMPAWFGVSASVIEGFIWAADIIVYLVFLGTECYESIMGTASRWRKRDG